MNERHEGVVDRAGCKHVLPRDAFLKRLVDIEIGMAFQMPLIFLQCRTHVVLFKHHLLPINLELAAARSKRTRRK